MWVSPGEMDQDGSILDPEPLRGGGTTPAADMATCRRCTRAFAIVKERNKFPGTRRRTQENARRNIRRTNAMPTLPDGLVALVPLEVTKGAMPDAVSNLPMETVVQKFMELSPLQQIGIPLLTYYLILAEPGPLRGILDFYIFNNVSKLLQRKFSVKDFSISNRIGVGNFGYVFEGELVQVRSSDVAWSRTGPPESIKATDGVFSFAEQNNGNFSTESRKKNRVVLKQTRTDTLGVRDDFLYRGTVAIGAAESGAAEAYMCGLMQRSFGRSISADYMGSFIADSTARNFYAGQQWLVWKFESDATLGDFIRGKDCPLNMEEILFGREQKGSVGKRCTAIMRNVLGQVFRSLAKMHSIGLVHRDVKPSNLLITNTGKIKFIDFGATADLRMGINYSPDRGMLDPDYSPPEQLVLPRSFPRAPLPVIAALLSPFLWLAYTPGKFDTYSAGCILLQMGVPTLRGGLAKFQREIELYDYDLQAWRNGSISASRYDFSLLDRNRGLAWDLACKLICNRERFIGGRLTAAAALRHPFFWAPDLD